MAGDFSNRDRNAYDHPTAHVALSDEALMHQVQGGDGDAFTVLFDRSSQSPIRSRHHASESRPVASRDRDMRTLSDDCVLWRDWIEPKSHLPSTPNAASSCV
jgi:hypothetical protein